MSRFRGLALSMLLLLAGCSLGRGQASAPAEPAEPAEPAPRPPETAAPGGEPVSGAGPGADARAPSAGTPAAPESREPDAAAGAPAADVAAPASAAGVGTGGAAAAPHDPPLAPPPFVDLADPLDLLWGHRLEFGPGGEPIVTTRLMEGQREIAFRAGAAARVLLRGGAAVEVPAGARLVVRARDAVPPVIAWHAVLAGAPVAERARLEDARAHHAALGVEVRTLVVGGVYGLAGNVVDNRRELLVAAGDGTEAGARAAVERLRTTTGARPGLHAEVLARPAGRLVLSTDAGAPLGEAEAALTLVADGEAGFVVEDVEHEHGPRGRAREDRTYRGRLYVTIDARGLLAAVHGAPIEELLRGLVPSEMPASSPMEALKAQAVTARSNVLAQIGTRHLTDPFMICAEVHCQAYRGDAARTPRTDEAVRATRGEALFGRADRRLVDAVYSALCGGHGEHNDLVWGGAPSSSLRGQPDLGPDAAARWSGGLGDEDRLRSFLSAAPRAYCSGTSGARRDRYRWERRFEPADLDRLLGSLGVGRVEALEVRARGISGRARILGVTGSAGRAEVVGELKIRRLLRNLPSAMFVVDREGSALVLRGGGWGHGAGMCQWGAVGRAEAGEGYRAILRAYYSGAEVARIY